MSPIEIIALVVLAGYAVYRRTVLSEAGGRDRFRLAALYVAIGIAVGGFALPHGAISIGLLALSIALSAVIGLARGYQTRLWRAEDGRVLSRGRG